MYKKRMAGQGIDECIVRIMDQAYIPLDPDNIDYQQYLQWVSEGNVPEIYNQ